MHQRADLKPEPRQVAVEITWRKSMFQMAKNKLLITANACATKATPSWGKAVEQLRDQQFSWKCLSKAHSSTLLYFTLFLLQLGGVYRNFCTQWPQPQRTDPPPPTPPPPPVTLHPIEIKSEVWEQDGWGQFSERGAIAFIHWCEVSICKVLFWFIFINVCLRIIPKSWREITWILSVFKINSLRIDRPGKLCAHWETTGRWLNAGQPGPKLVGHKAQRQTSAWNTWERTAKSRWQMSKGSQHVLD